LLTSTSHASGFMSMCLVHDLAFPHGPESADLSQQFCHLIQENMRFANLHCEEQASMTGSTFLEAYEPHTEFCRGNADLVSSVLDGSHPEAEAILDVAFAESLVIMNYDGDEEGRRNLFVGDMISEIGNAWSSIWEFGGLAGIIGGAFGALLVAFLIVVMLGRRNRRALEASPTAPTSFAFSGTTILTECAQGVDSFLCEMPVNELLRVFTTGMCASVGGLLCVVSQDDLLALLPTAGGN